MIGAQSVRVDAAASDVLSEIEKLQTTVPASAHQDQMEDVKSKARECAKRGVSKLVNEADSVLAARTALAGFEEAIKGVTPAMVQNPPADPAIVAAVKAVTDPLSWCSKKVDADALSERFRILLQKGATHVVNGHFVDEHENGFPDMETVAPALPPVTGNLQKLEASVSADPKNAVNLINQFVDGGGAQKGTADALLPSGASASGAAAAFDYKTANQQAGKQPGFKPKDVPAADLGGGAPGADSEQLHRMKLATLAAMKSLPFVSVFAQRMLAQDLIPPGSQVQSGVDHNGGAIFTFSADPKTPMTPKQVDDVASVFVAAQERFQGVHRTDVTEQKEKSMAALLRDQFSDGAAGSGPAAVTNVEAAMTANGQLEIVRTRANGTVSSMMAAFEPTLSGRGDGVTAVDGKGPGLGLTVYSGMPDGKGNVMYRQSFQYVGDGIRERVGINTEVTQGFWSAATATNKSYVERSYRKADGTWQTSPSDRTALKDQVVFSGPGYLALTAEGVGTVGKGMFDVGGGFIALGLAVNAPTTSIRDSLLAQARQDILNNAVNKEILPAMGASLLAPDDPSLSVRTGLGAQIRKLWGDDGFAGIAANTSDAVLDKVAPSLMLGVPGAKMVFTQLAKMSPLVARTALTGTVMYGGWQGGQDTASFIKAEEQFEKNPTQENRSARDAAETGLIADTVNFIPMTNYAKAIRENSGVPETASSDEAPAASPRLPPPLPSPAPEPAGEHAAPPPNDAPVAAAPMEGAAPAPAPAPTPAPDPAPAPAPSATPPPLPPPAVAGETSKPPPVAKSAWQKHVDNFVQEVHKDEDGLQKLVSGFLYAPNPHMPFTSASALTAAPTAGPTGLPSTPGPGLAAASGSGLTGGTGSAFAGPVAVAVPAAPAPDAGPAPAPAAFSPAGRR